MLIDYTFFQGGNTDIDGIILNEHLPDETTEGIKSSMDQFIMEYEEEYLCKLLGEKLSAELTEYVNRKDKDVKEAHWEKLIGMLVKQLRHNDEIFPASPIANYVYFFYLRHNHTQATTTGVKADGDEGKLVSPERKMVFAWNGMVRMNRRIFEYLKENRHEYKGWNPDMELVETINTFGL